MTGRNQGNHYIRGFSIIQQVTTKYTTEEL